MWILNFFIFMAISLVILQLLIVCDDINKNVQHIDYWKLYKIFSYIPGGLFLIFAIEPLIEKWEKKKEECKVEFSIYIGEVGSKKDEIEKYSFAMHIENLLYIYM